MDFSKNSVIMSNKPLDKQSVSMILIRCVEKRGVLCCAMKKRSFWAPLLHYFAAIEFRLLMGFRV